MSPVSLKAGPGVGGPEDGVRLPPARRRIVDRMDRAGDRDGWVSLAELRSWIAHTRSSALACGTQ